MLICIAGYAADAGAKGNFRITGKIFSAITSKDIPGAKVELLSRDSVVLATDTALWHGYRVIDHSLEEYEEAVYEFRIDKAKEKFIIRASAPDYEPQCLDIDLTGVGSRQDNYQVKGIYLRPATKATELGEVVVKASKVKFYNKGDTIVYNADAFMLPEGSMLDALIEQLPGVEIRDGGAIYVNGRYVESLLLNGKDFFQGNREVMLQNMGAYMVKDVEVYEKLGEKSRMMGHKVAEDTQYVMDVKLRKDYMAGNLLNLKAQGGTHDRYLAKLFGLHYTNNSRLSVYADANNLNDSEKPNSGGDNIYSLYDSPAPGLTTVRRGGIDYFADNPLHTFEINGNVDVRYDKNQNNTDVYRTNFLTGGNTYDYSFSRPTARNLRVSTQHSLRLKHETWNLDVKPAFSYNHNKSESESSAATFNANIPGITKEEIDNIFQSDRFSRRNLVNRSLSRSKSLRHGIDASLFSEFFFKVLQSSDLTSIWVNGRYSDYRDENDNTSDIAYGPRPESNQVLRQHYIPVPNRDLHFDAGAKYYFNIPRGTTGLMYFYNFDRERRRSELYLLQSTTNDTVNPGDFAGMTPEFDPANSYISHLTTQRHDLRPFYTQDFPIGNGTIDFKVSPQLSFVDRRLHYVRGAIDTRINKDNVLFRIMDTYLMWRSSDRSQWARLTYERTPDMPTLIDMIDFTDTTDPLNLREGNPDLRNSVSNDFRLVYGYFSPSRPTHTFTASYGWIENDITRGYRYDSQTGVRTYKSYNVSGNYHLNLRYYTDIRLGHNGEKPFNIHAFIGYGQSQYANMIGVDMEPQKQRVKNTLLQFNLNPGFAKEFDKERYYFGLTCFATYDHTYGDRQSDNYNAWGVTYGFSGMYRFRFGFEIGTNLNITSRSGYSQKEMNDTRALWNAYASYTMLKGALTLRLDGYDMLAQTRNYDYQINALGRVETHYMALPRYVTLSIAYRMDFRPKREKRQ